MSRSIRDLTFSQISKADLMWNVPSRQYAVWKMTWFDHDIIAENPTGYKNFSFYNGIFHSDLWKSVGKGVGGRGSGSMVDAVDTICGSIPGIAVD
jgi:hypothetical protein